MDDNSFKSFEELKCWQACREVRIFIIGLVKNYPKEEKYSLVDNMKRAARSTTQNIAEGFGRFHYKEMPSFAALAAAHCSSCSMILLPPSMKNILISKITSKAENSSPMPWLF